MRHWLDDNGDIWIFGVMVAAAVAAIALVVTVWFASRMLI